MRHTSLYSLCLTVSMLCSLSACGGGGGSDANVNSNTSSAPSGSTNAAPTADAGDNKSVFEGETVGLTGSGSDADGSISTYSWSQTGGIAVDMVGANTSLLDFVAPNVSATEMLSFDLTVTDNSGATASDSVSVVVAQTLPVSLTLQPDTITKSAFAKFEFSAENASAYQCQHNSEPVISCESPFLLYPLSSGDHNLKITGMASDSTLGQSTETSWTVSSLFGDNADTSIDDNLIRTDVEPAAVAPNSWRGILRINCDFAHSDYDDPIVFPGQNGAAHLHRFYGNTLLDEHSDIDSLFTTGESSCQGNQLNRSAYWIPALLAPAYDPNTQERLLDMQGNPAFKVVPAVVGNDDVAHEVFYYSAGVDDLASIEPIPLGLKMIAGDHMSNPENPQDTAIVRWHCQSWGSDDATNPQWSVSIPECVAPDRVRMDIFFPSCWNGTDLDSTDHKSHLAYPENPTASANGTICPASHPVPIIRVSFHYAFGVKPDVYDPATQSSRGWQIASDAYDVTPATPGGQSLHGDWFNAWHPEALDAVLEGCIKNELDCHDGNLGNGFRLSGTRPGTQSAPDTLIHGVSSPTHMPG